MPPVYWTIAQAALLRKQQQLKSQNSSNNWDYSQDITIWDKMNVDPNTGKLDGTGTATKSVTTYNSWWAQTWYSTQSISSPSVTSVNNTSSSTTYWWSPTTPVVWSTASRFSVNNNKYAPIKDKNTTVNIPTTVDFSKMKFWQDAINANTQDNTYLNTRNSQLATHYGTQWITDIAGIKADLMKQPWYAAKSVAEQDNTAKSIADMITKQNGWYSVDKTIGDSMSIDPNTGKLTWKGTNTVNWQVTDPNTPVDPAQQQLNNLKKEYGMASLKWEADISDFLRTAFGNQQSIDKESSKFSNWDKVNWEVSSVIDAISRNKIQDASKWLQPWAAPTESDISAAMNATWLSRDRIIAIANGQWYDSLEYSDTEKANQTRQFDRSVEDAQQQKDRAVEDANMQLDQTRQNITNQISDITKQLWLDVTNNEKIGALTGRNRSSWFVQGIQNIHDDAQRLIDRAQQTLSNAEHSNTIAQGRWIQDFNTNLSRAKFDLDKEMLEFKAKAGAEIWTMQSKYSLGSANMQTVIDDMFTKLDTSKADILLKYQTSQRAAIQNASDQLDLNIKDSTQQMTKMNATVAAINANNGETLNNMTVWQLAQMHAAWMPTEQVKMYRDAMVSKTIASFPSLPANVREQVSQAIDKWQTPIQVIQSLKDQWYSPLADVSGSKIVNIKVNGEDVSVMQDAQGRLRPLDTSWLGISNMGGGMSGWGSYTPSNSNPQAWDPKATPAVRNNNPGNIKDKWTAGNDSRWFAIYNTPQEWFDALVNKLQNAQMGKSAWAKPDMTLLQYMSKYAPSSDNNNPDAYARSIAKNLWISIATPISDIDPQWWAKEISRHEDGNMFKIMFESGNNWGNNSNFKEELIPLYNKYLEKWTIDQTDLKGTWLNNNTFMQQANAYKNSQKNNWVNKPSNDPSILELIELPEWAKEPQVKSKYFADRMNYAANQLISIEKNFADSGTLWQSFQTHAPNFLKSQDQQYLEVAKKNFITASLRQESWAAISPWEFDSEEKKYFPQVWDTPDTIKAKQKARELAIQGMYSQAWNDVNGINVWKLYQQRDIDALWNWWTTTWNNDNWSQSNTSWLSTTGTSRRK